MELFNNSGGSYVIPSYQRQFRWKTEKSGQLISDIYAYYNMTVQDYMSSITDPSSPSRGKFEVSNKFVGTLIAVNGGEFLEKISGSTKLTAIIDGQQRLTTFILLLMAIYLRIKKHQHNVNEKLEGESAVDEVRKPYYRTVLDDIKKFAGRPVELCLLTPQEHPRFGREKGATDTGNTNIRGDNWKSGEFVTDIPRLINACIKFNGKSEDDESLEQRILDQVDGISTKIKESFLMIGSFLDIVESGLNFESMTKQKKSAWDKYKVHLPSDGLPLNYICKFSGCEGFKTCFTLDIKTALLGYDPEVERIARLLSFTNFYLEFVYVAKVVCRPNNYLDIFESLNTSGTALTPLETFVPEVYQFYEKTNTSEDYLRKEDILISKNSLNNKSKGLRPGSLTSPESILSAMQTMLESNNIEKSAPIVVSFSLINSGERCPEDPNGQRLFLMRSLEIAAQDYFKNKTSENLDPIRNYLYVLYETVRWWCLLNDNKQIEENLNEIFNHTNKTTEEDRLEDEAEFCLLVLKKANLTLAQSIACRFYIQYLQAKSPEDQDATYFIFLKVIRALAAFSALWLSSYETTNGIDEVFRDILAGQKYSTIPLVTGFRVVDKGNAPVRVPGKQGIITEKDVIERLRCALNQKFKGFSLMAWQRKMMFASTATRVAISKMLVLLYLTNSKPEKTSGLRKLDSTTRPDGYLTARQWRIHSSDDYDLEHVMPQTLTKDWVPKLNGRHTLESQIVQQLGNVTLLPKKINRKLKNSSWQKKSCVYRILCSDSCSLKQLPEWLTKGMKRSELNDLDEWISKRIQDPVAELASEKIDWDSNFIAKRTLCMTQIIWKNLTDFLDLDAFGSAESLKPDDLWPENQEAQALGKSTRGAKRTLSGSSSSTDELKDVQTSEQWKEGACSNPKTLKAVIQATPSSKRYVSVFKNAVTKLSKEAGLGNNIRYQANEIQWVLSSAEQTQKTISLSLTDDGVLLSLEKPAGKKLRGVSELPFYNKKQSGNSHAFTLTDIGQIDQIVNRISLYYVDFLENH